jgi:hypothetical protein
MKLIASHLDHARSVLAHLAIVCLALAFKNAPGAEIRVESLSLERRQEILNDINAFRSKDQKCDGQSINPGIEKPFTWDETVEQVAKEQSADMAEHNTLGYDDEIERKVNNAVIEKGYRAIYIRTILRRGNYKKAIKALLVEPTKYQEDCGKIMFNHPNGARIAIGRAIRIESNSKKRFWILIMFAPESVRQPPDLSALLESEDNIIFEKGWLLADKPKSPIGKSYVPGKEYQYNLRFDRLSNGSRKFYPTANNTVTRLAVGRYRVDLPNFGSTDPSLGIAHVTGYGGKYHCKILSKQRTPMASQVFIGCFNFKGTFTDGKFSMLFYKDGLNSDVYANAYISGAGGSQDRAAMSYNSRVGVGPSFIKRVSIGQYQAELPSMEIRPGEVDKGGVVLVTGYGYGPERCKVVSWYPPIDIDPNTILAHVNCFAPDGTPADSHFALSFMREPGTLGIEKNSDRKEAFYMWGDAPPVPDPYYMSDSYGQANASLEQPKTGTYIVHLSGLKSSNTTNVQITAYGPDNAYCNVKKWDKDSAGDGTDVVVECFNNAGNPADSKFTMLYYTDTDVHFVVE